MNTKNQYSGSPNSNQSMQPNPADGRTALKRVNAQSSAPPKPKLAPPPASDPSLRRQMVLRGGRPVNPYYEANHGAAGKAAGSGNPNVARRKRGAND